MELRRTFARLSNNADLLVLLLLPIFLLLINPVWLSNKFGDIDTWFYYGHFLNLFHHPENINPIPADYYRTRIPYTLPGAVFYQFLSDKAARLGFMALIYSITVLSFWYVVRTHTNRAVAFASTALLAMDLYFIRSMGWQYVDNGVLAYQSLTLAFITLATTGKNPRRYFALAGFTAASMIATHLVSAIFLFTFVFYTYVMLTRASPETPIMVRVKTPFLFTVFGALLCQTLYGAMHMWLHQGNFFFLLEQIKTASVEAHTVGYAMPPPFLIQSGTWLTVHGAAWLGSIIGLIISLWRHKSIRDFQVFCFANAVFLLSLVTILEALHRTYFLSREGEYISFFLITTYLAVTALLFHSPRTGWHMAVLALAASMATVCYRLTYDGQPPELFHISVLWLAIIAGVALAVPVVVSRPNLRLLSLLIFCAVAAMTPWQFYRDDSINEAHTLIHNFAGSRTPRIFFNGAALQETLLFRSITATFTERGWWRHGEGYPDFSINFWKPFFDFHTGDVVVVLSPTVANEADVRAALAPWVDGITSSQSFYVDRKDFGFWIHCFEIIRHDTSRLPETHDGQ